MTMAVVTPAVRGRDGSPSDMPDLDTVLAWRGKTVVDRDGEKVGQLGALYLDEEDHPAYAGVQTGLFRRRETMVPLAGARELGDDVQLPYALEQIRSAPNVDVDVALTDSEQGTRARRPRAMERRRRGGQA